MNKIVICDLDGTIVDSRTDLTNTVNGVRAEYKLPPLDIDTVTSYIGNGSRLLMERALKGTAIDIEKAFRLMQKFYSENVLGETTVYPTVEEGIKLLISKGYKMAIATNKPQKPTEQLLNGLGLSKHFDVILGGSDDYQLKPDPAMLNIAMERTGSSSEQSWMIGDNYTDLESGRRAGVKRCFAKFGFGLKKKEDFELAVDSFAEFAESL